MTTNLFGFEIKRQKPLKKDNLQALPKDENQDGAIDISSNFYGFYNFGVNLDPETFEDENKLVTRYRDMAIQPEIERAIDDIINDTFSYDKEHYPVKLNLNNIFNIDNSVKETMVKEFENIQDMLNFKNDCYEIFRRWYVDGRLYYQKVIDTENVKDGIQELRYIDPRKIRKVKEEKKKVPGPTPAPSGARILKDELSKEYYEYYLYNPTGISSKKPTGVNIAPDSIVFIHSGIFDKANKVIFSNLHRAMKHFNNLRMLEDSVVIYRLTRSPEKRIFNIEVGRLPKMKAEQHLMDVISKHRKKLVYDPETGEIKDTKKIMTMLEDYWFPQREGKGTTVTTLPRGEALDKIEDVEYFKKKLYEALNVPYARYQEGAALFDRGSQVTRDELKFSKFISRLRKRFAVLLEDLLKTQLILKNVMTLDEWEAIKGKIVYNYIEDSYVAEQKRIEILQTRAAAFQAIVPIAEAKFVSRKWIRENILQISEEEYTKIKEEIMKEQTEEPWPISPMSAPMGMDGQPPMEDTGIETADGGFQVPQDDADSEFAPQQEQWNNKKLIQLLNEILK